jgi:hypothetical protein
MVPPFSRFRQTVYQLKADQRALGAASFGANARPNWRERECLTGAQWQ